MLFHDNKGRARAARVLFLLSFLVCLLTVVLSLAGLARPSLLDVSDQHLGAAAFMGSYGLLLIVQVLLNLASLIVFIMWLRRAYYNLHQVPGLLLAHGEGWAAGAWFVPFLNLYRPFTIAREVWLDTQQTAFGEVRRPATILGWWWAAFIVKVVAGRLANSLSKGDNISANDLGLLLFDGLANVAFAALTWLIIGQLRPYEDELLLRQQVQQLGQPAPAGATAAAGYDVEQG